jgi:phage terminase small subunit
VPLNAKQQRFVAEYLKDLNATQAAIRSGYSRKTAAAIGSENLSKPEIAAAISEKTERIAQKAEVSAAYVLSSLLNIAERCQQAVPVYERVNGETLATGEYEFDSSGANKSLELLGKHLKLWTDKQELSGTGGKSISISIGGIAK